MPRDDRRSHNIAATSAFDLQWAMRYVALILFLPWFAVIGFAYWHLPRDLQRPIARRVFDWSAIALSMGMALIGALVAVDMPWKHTGKIWPQVAAVLFAYGAFLLMMACAAVIRQRVWRANH